MGDLPRPEEIDKEKPFKHRLPNTLDVIELDKGWSWITLCKLTFLLFGQKTDWPRCQRMLVDEAHRIVWVCIQIQCLTDWTVTGRMHIQTWAWAPRCISSGVLGITSISSLCGHQVETVIGSFVLDPGIHCLCLVLWFEAVGGGWETKLCKLNSDNLILQILLGFMFLHYVLSDTTPANPTILTWFLEGRSQS